MLRALGLVLTVFLVAASPAPTVVSVAYAGSLVTPMEGPIAQRLAATTGIQFQGEGKGSKALANLIRDGIRNPDIFISADSALVDQLAKDGLIASSVTFGGASMVLGYSPKSTVAPLLAAVASGHGDLLSVLERPGLRIARTDPLLDPKGARTLQAMNILAGPATTQAILGPDENPAQIFPEEGLLVRLESGDADVAFLYSTEALARHIPFVPLPGKAALSDEITYTLAVMAHAPHPQAAAAFSAFLLHGEGKLILEHAGVQYFSK